MKVEEEEEEEEQVRDTLRGTKSRKVAVCESR